MAKGQQAGSQPGEIGVWLYDQIPGVWERWTVAITAVSKADADRRKRIIWHGGHCVGQASPGKVQADCGDITDAAQEVLRRKHEAFLNGL